MNAIDFSPLFRTAIGFDRLARLMDNARTVPEANGYPPYNIEKAGDNATSGIVDEWTDQAEERAWFLFEASRKS